MTLESYAVAKQEYKIFSEYKMLQSEVVEGVYVIPSFKSSFMWFGVLFVRFGIYKDAILRFNISLPENFPNSTSVPTVIFQTQILHPLVCPFTGNLNLSDGFEKWNINENHIWQILKYIQFCFENVSSCHKAKNILNSDAFNLLSQNKAAFISKVHEDVRVSRDSIYNLPPTDDVHYIIFDKFDNILHTPIIKNIKNNITIES